MYYHHIALTWFSPGLIQVDARTSMIKARLLHVEDWDSFQINLAILILRYKVIFLEPIYLKIISIRL